MSVDNVHAAKYQTPAPEPEELPPEADDAVLLEPPDNRLNGASTAGSKLALYTCIESKSFF